MPPTARVDAIVLAGGELERNRFPGLPPEISSKAEIPVLGQALIAWTLRALRETPQVGRVILVGPAGLDLDPALADESLPDAGSITANLRAGLEALQSPNSKNQTSKRVLVVSGDLPLLTSKAVVDLLVLSSDADLVFPIVERADTLDAFPDREWIFARTADGLFTGCSAAVIKPGPVLENWHWVEELLEARRKKPLALAAMFGLPFALKLLTGRLRLAEAEATLSRLLHVRGRAYRTRFAELAMDVDKESDLPLVEEVLRRSGAETGLRSQAVPPPTPDTQREEP